MSQSSTTGRALSGVTKTLSRKMAVAVAGVAVAVAAVAAASMSSGDEFRGAPSLTPSLFTENPFLEANTVGLPANPPARFGPGAGSLDQFMYWNTAAFDYHRVPYSERFRGPR
jgi:hypothetical protein